MESNRKEPHYLFYEIFYSLPSLLPDYLFEEQERSIEFDGVRQR